MTLFSLILIGELSVVEAAESPLSTLTDPASDALLRGVESPPPAAEPTQPEAEAAVRR